MQALISICIGWSGPSLSTYRINGYCSICWHYKNTPIQIKLKISPPKNWKFSDKNYSSHISAQNIDCGYPQSMFLSRIKKNNVYPCKPQFYYIKVGLRGSKLYRYVFVMTNRMSRSDCTEQMHTLIWSFAVHMWHKGLLPCCISFTIFTLSFTFTLISTHGYYSNIIHWHFSSLGKQVYSNILKILPPKNENFQIKNFWYISCFCSKHRLWVLVRTA